MASNIKVVLEVDNKKYLSDIKASENATKKFGDEGSKLGSTLSPSLNKVALAADGVRGKLESLRGVLATVISAAAIQQANAYANEVKDISETADVSVASILGLSKAFQVNGGSAEGARNAILKFGQTIGDAVAGSAEAQKSLEDVGISLKDIQTLGQQDLLTKAVKGIANLESAAMRAKAQMAIFGKQAKSVNFPGVQETFGAGTKDSAKYESSIKAGSDASEALNKNLDNLKQALLNVAEPLNKLVASINITVAGFETFLKIIAAVGVAYFAFGKATSFVWSTFDGVGKAVKASGGVIAMVGGELARFGGMIKSVFMNIGRAFGIFETAYGGVASLGFALSGVLRIGLRFLGWVGVFTAVGEAINWAIKQLTGFDVIDAVSAKLGALWDKAKSIVGLGDSGAGGGRGGNADTLKAQQAQGEEMRKAWEAQQKAIDEAKAKQEEFNKRTRILKAEIEKVGDAYDFNSRHRIMDLQLETLLVGKTEDQVELFRALDGQAKQLEETIKSLRDKKKEWALSGTPEQKANIGLIDAEINKLVELSEARRDDLIANINSLQGARMIEKARIQDLENLTKAMDEAQKRQEALANTRLGMIGQKQDVEFAGQQQGRSPFQQQAAEIVNNARKAALEAGRAYAAAFEDTGDGLTPERAQELADGLEAIRQGYASIAEAQMKNLETSREWSQGWKEAFMAYTDSAQNSAEQAKTYFDTFSRGAEDALVNFVRTGKLSFKDLANSLIADFARIQAKKAIAGLFSMGGGGGAGGFSFGSMFSSLGGLFGGGKASGGAVEAGKSFLVGERGPEMFTPNGSGTIIPNNALGGGTTVQQITYNIQATDAASFKQQLARDPAFVHALVEQGRRSTPAGARR